MKYFSVLVLLFLCYITLCSSAAVKEESKDDLCNLPQRVGRCRASQPRIYYDAKEEKCVKFTFGGCDGNANNFATIEECEAACTGIKAKTAAV